MFQIFQHRLKRNPYADKRDSFEKDILSLEIYGKIIQSSQ